MISVDLYTKEDCSLCDQAKEVILRVRDTVPFSFRMVQLVPGTEEEKQFRNDIPVVLINGQLRFRHRVSETEFLGHLNELRNARRQ